MKNQKRKSMLVTKDGNYHKSYHLPTNLKKEEEDNPPPLPLSTFFFSYHQGRLFYEISPKRRAFRRVLRVLLRPAPSTILTRTK
jgi:hypothetical protein